MSGLTRPRAARASCIVLAGLLAGQSAATPPAAGDGLSETALAQLADAERLGPSEQQIEIRRRLLGPDHPLIADALADWAARLLVERRFEPAEPPAREALAMRRRLVGPDHLDIADSLDTLASILRERRQRLEPIELRREALAMRRRLLEPTDPAVIDSLQRLASTYTGASRYGLAERTWREALALLRQVDPPDLLRLAGALNALADLLRWENDLQQARDMLEQALALRRQAQPDSPELAESLESMAMLHRFERRHDLALPLLLETIAIRSRSLGDSHFLTLVGRANLALNYAYMGQHDDAEMLFAALRAKVAGAGPETDLSALDRLLDTYMSSAAEFKGDWASAETYRRASLRDMEEKGHTIELAENLRKLAEYRAAQGDLADAERLLTRAAASFESARQLLDPGLTRASFKKTPYEQLALVRLEQGHFDQAWPALEAARARLLADLLVAGKTPRSEALAESPFPLSRVQAMLEPDTALVGWLDFQLYRGRGLSWAYVIRHQGPVRWVRLPEAGDVEALASEMRSFRDRLDQAAGSSLGAGADDGALPDLHGRRFAPLEPRLGGVQRLVIIPSWAMGGFPVEVLQDPDQRYLGDRFDVSYAPSATVYTWLREDAGHGPGAARTGLLIGDPPFSRARSEESLEQASADPAAPALRSALRGDARALEGLPRLPWSRREITRLSGLLAGSKVLVGPDASEPGLAALAHSGGLAGYSLVHIATHALIDDEQPQLSGLVLSQQDLPGESTPGAPGAAYDGIVTGDEILEQWRLDADLVTLSACQTALGRNLFGEGVVGLSYPLLQAGARSLLLSLWKVDDEATAMLMEQFYRSWLGTGEKPTGKAAALRQARRWLRDYTTVSGERPFAHPAYWSAFVLIGDPR